MSKRKRILVIDDEPDFLELIRIELEMEDYEIIAASDGQEGLLKAHNDKPDLILLDIMMPKMNGYQVCRELKGTEDTKTIPVIMLTARGQESDKFWGKDTGANDYVVKPFEAKELIQKIKSLLGK